MLHHVNKKEIVSNNNGPYLAKSFTNEKTSLQTEIRWWLFNCQNNVLCLIMLLVFLKVLLLSWEYLYVRRCLFYRGFLFEYESKLIGDIQSIIHGNHIKFI